jgi:hypothetical protein
MSIGNGGGDIDRITRSHWHGGGQLERVSYQVRNSELVGILGS